MIKIKNELTKTVNIIIKQNFFNVYYKFWINLLKSINLFNISIISFSLIKF